MAEVAVADGLALGLVATVFVAGLRHGFDIDHIAAISDITSSQFERKRALVLATIYAFGHLLVVFALGIAAVLAGEALSGALDSFAGRVVGVTLLLLGCYVVYSLFRFRHDFRIKSRWALAVSGVRRVVNWMRSEAPVVIEHEHDHHAGGHHHHPAPGAPVRDLAPEGPAVATATKTHRHMHRHVVPMPSDPFTDYGGRTAFLVGMVHGVGAETSTQLLLFTSAAGLAGSWGGIALVLAFCLGLLVGNSILTLVTTAGFAAGRRVPRLHLILGALTAAISLYVGAAYTLGRPELLPSVLGG